MKKDSVGAVKAEELLSGQVKLISDKTYVLQSGSVTVTNKHHKFEIIMLYLKKNALGVLIDNNLDRKHHIKQVCKKNSSGAWAIPRLKDNTCTLKSVYYFLIYSHLTYCINAWGSASSCSLKPLQIGLLQKHFIRLIASSEYRARSSPLFSNYKFYSWKILQIQHESTLRP